MTAARTRTARPTADNSATMRSMGAQVTDPAEQQIAVPEETERETAASSAGRDVTVPEDMAALATDYIKAKGYGPKMSQIIGYIASKALDTSELNSVIMELLAERILDAESPEAIADPFGTVAGKDMYERPLFVTGVTFLVSTQGEGFPWYVALDVTDPRTRENAVITVGGEKFVPQVAGMDMHDAWPRAIIIHESDKPTASGYRVIEMRIPKA